MFTKRDAHVSPAIVSASPSPRNLSPRSRRPEPERHGGKVLLRRVRRDRSSPRPFQGSEMLDSRNQTQSESFTPNTVNWNQPNFSPNVRNSDLSVCPRFKNVSFVSSTAQLRRRRSRNDVNYRRVAHNVIGLLLFWMKLCHFRKALDLLLVCRSSDPSDPLSRTDARKPHLCFCTTFDVLRFKPHRCGLLHPRRSSLHALRAGRFGGGDSGGLRGPHGHRLHLLSELVSVFTEMGA